MNLRQAFLNLTEAQKRFVHFYLCENALGILEKYFKESGRIEYVESVVGTLQVFDPKLPRDAFFSAQKGENLDDTDYRFAEPIAAMQDDDLSFPNHIELGFYSIYNLFQKYVLHQEIEDWVIVNQSLTAETDEIIVAELLEKAIGESECLIELRQNFLN